MKSTLLIDGVIALALAANPAMQHAGEQSAPKFTVDPSFGKVFYPVINGRRRLR